MTIYALKTNFFNLTAGSNEEKLSFVTLYYSLVYGEIDTTRYLSKLIHERIGNNKSVNHVGQEDPEHASIHQNDPHFSFKDAAQGSQIPHMHFKCEPSELKSTFNHLLDVIAIAGADFESANNLKNKIGTDGWAKWAAENKIEFSQWLRPTQSKTDALAI